jgi:TLD
MNRISVNTGTTNETEDDGDHDNEMMISAAAAASSALMGENIIDSPNTRRSHKQPQARFVPAVNEKESIPVATLPNLPDLKKNGDESSLGLDSSSHHSTHTQQSRASSNNNNNSNNNGLSVGIVAQGLAWAKQQKYKRQRQYLQYQAEQQILKLQLATERSDQQQQEENEMMNDDTNNNINNDKSTGRSIFFDPTSLQNWLQNLTSIPTSSSTQCDDVEHDRRRRGRRTTSRTNSKEYSGSHSNSNVSESSNDNNNDEYDDENDNSSHYQFCSVSQSGLGYSVELPKLFNPPPSTASHTLTPKSSTASKNDDIDDNDDDDDTSWIPQVRVEDATTYDDYSNAIHSDHSNDDNINGTNNVQQQENRIIDTVSMPEVHPPYLLSSDEMYQIAVKVLPRNIVYCKWKRYYSLVRDGDSFDNCLRQVQHCKQSLMIIRTTKNDRFGTYVDAPWDTTHSQQHGTIQYYGGPETCLFKIVNENVDTVDTSTDVTCRKNSKVICYTWSGMNRYIQLCDHQNKMIAIGGGNGSFGLCIQQDFQYGSTGTCTTFQNEPLCPDEQFSILDVEIYGFLLGQF